MGKKNKARNRSHDSESAQDDTSDAFISGIQHAHPYPHAAGASVGSGSGSGSGSGAASSPDSLTDCPHGAKALRMSSVRPAIKNLSKQSDFGQCESCPTPAAKRAGGGAKSSTPGSVAQPQPQAPATATAPAAVQPSLQPPSTPETASDNEQIQGQPSSGLAGSETPQPATASAANASESLIDPSSATITVPSVVDGHAVQQQTSCEQPKPIANTPDTALDVSNAHIFMCLTCGVRGCSRSDPGQHALVHSQAKASHVLAISLQEHTVWCYACDDYVKLVQGQELLGEIRDLLEHQWDKACRKTSTFAPGASPATASPSSGTKAAAIVETTSSAGAPSKVGKSKHNQPGKAVLVATNLAAAPAKELHPLHAQPSTAASASLYSVAAIPVRGLHNLGNTCFFNSVCQALAQTMPLAQMTLLSDALDYSRPTRAALLSTVAAIRTGSSSSPFTPSELLNRAGAANRRFRGRAQQDAQELLRCLLDAALEEDRAHLKQKNSGSRQPTPTPSESASTADPALSKSGEEEKADESEQARQQPTARVKTWVDDIFGGTLESRVTCVACGYVSTTHEPFLDLSIEIPPLFEDGSSKRKAQSAAAAAHALRPSSASTRAMDELASQTTSKHQQKKAAEAKRQLLKKERRLASKRGDSSHSNSESTEPKAESESAETSDELQVPAVPPTSQGGTQEGDQDAVSEAAVSHEGDSNPVSETASMAIVEDTETRPSIPEDVTPSEVRAPAPHVAHNFKPGSLEACLSAFFVKERLEGNNRYGCKNCYSLRMKRSGSAEVATPSADSNTEPDANDENASDPTHAVRANLAALHISTKKPDAADLPLAGKYAVLRAQPKKAKDPEVDRQDADKQFLLHTAPNCLVVHLKRFCQTRHGAEKNTRSVPFPLVLDMTPFTTMANDSVESSSSSSSASSSVIYDLYAIVVHMGGMGGGHYIANVKSRREGGLDSWFSVSDSHVSTMEVPSVLSSQAFMLFYERRTADPTPVH
ncbi:hypothetical protein CAOG_00185 [Capsaspora owczarzaki ATCC 30864]|uniref:Uncharacterized protein n=1 Tax=Capsaspora owczarzaki (strain ATCC 30864) TaxID=595528 RepID=A0A0D2X070_CAPO3|nr:hypothetical protein CAOG_00185 [Capsaspora owczarzaki ATCC 30864]KJE88544.1 hypothetical protein CAOG_000185 [Capsaspora owczarzaki ATCC 30864]|eukprot:XP_004365056.1 hypothetical protein CAOG_00185 [Capsaspora owczarzaki ATCC 30864]